MASISGRVAASTRLGFEDAREQRQLAEEIARREGQQQLENAVRLRKIVSDEQQHRDELGFRESEAKRAGEQFERTRRDVANRTGLEQMSRDRQVFEEEETQRALETALNDPSTPPALKKIIGLRKIGINASPSAEMLRSPEERAEEERRELDRVAKEAEIRARTEAKYRTPRQEDQVPVVVNGKTVYLTPSQINARGGVDPTPRQRPVTGAERLTRGFYTRMDEALQVMDQLEDGLTERDIALINDSPLPGLLNNRMLSGPGQQYAQALKTYTEARLRKESGAAIPPHEFESDRRTIGRQVFDKPETIRQKRGTRRTTAEGLASASGGAYEEHYGEPFQRRQQQQGGGLKVRMQAPDGSIQEVDQSQVDHFKARGAKVVGAP